MSKILPFIRVINDPDSQATEMTDKLTCVGKRGKFVLCIASTHTSDVHQISLAGMTPADRRLVPAADAELVVNGYPLSLPCMPVLPKSTVSPAVISRACSELINLDVVVVNCGVFQPPSVPHLQMGKSVAKCVSTGQALPLDEVESLFLKGCDFGATLDAEYDFVLIGEVVPGGTTTALGVLTALGYNAKGLVSGSIPQSNHELKEKLINEGLSKIGVIRSSFLNNPLTAVAAVGDPMQPFAAGLAITASKALPVVLGGGSQMLTVYKLAQLIEKTDPAKSKPLALVVATTKWAADDPSAGTKQLSELLTCPLFCSSLDFSKSVHPGLRLYEDNYVKEGVGAGAAMALASLVGGFSQEEILKKIDQVVRDLFSSQAHTVLS